MNSLISLTTDLSRSAPFLFSLPPYFARGFGLIVLTVGVMPNCVCLLRVLAPSFTPLVVCVPLARFSSSSTPSFPPAALCSDDLE